jgi:hypothetical protein
MSAKKYGQHERDLEWAIAQLVDDREPYFIANEAEKPIALAYFSDTRRWQGLEHHRRVKLMVKTRDEWSCRATLVRASGAWRRDRDKEQR